MKTHSLLLGLAVLIFFPQTAFSQNIWKDYKNSHHLDLPKQYKKVDDFVYRGPRPREISNGINDYQFLKNTLGITTDVNLEEMPQHTVYEAHTMPQYQIAYVDAYINGSPVQPDQAEVDKAVHALLDNSQHGKKSYVHCALGRDRTGLIVAEYEIEAGEKTPQDAWNEMVADGYNPKKATLVGIRNYFTARYPQVDVNSPVQQPPAQAAQP